MPFYEYECSSCKFATEVMQKISDAPLRKCPSCGKNTLKKLISAPVFRLKGGGWYETDFKSNAEKKRNLAGAEEGPASAPAEKDGKAETDGKKETKTETQSESKAKSKAEKPAAKPKATRKKALKTPKKR